MPSARVRVPFQVILIASIQFAKAAFLLIVSGFLLFAPDLLPQSGMFNQMLVVAAHGKNVSGVLVPIFGFYLIYVGVQLLRLRRATRRSLAISSVITICASLQRLGLFGETGMTSYFD